MENDCNQMIKAILSFKSAVKGIDDKASNKLAYLLGEYYALQQILQRYPTAIHRGGQGHFDIEIKNPAIKIEVKTSTYKEDKRVYPGIWLWGWTVETSKQQTRRKKTGEKRFDYLITVSLDETWENPRFQIFSWKEAIDENPDIEIKGLSNIKKRIHLFQNSEDFQKARNIARQFPEKYREPSKLEEDIIENPKKFENNWNRIS